ncbi:hypothetical protein MicloDRAFT_00021000 [Microvirga lotononidis]|uniref:Uncharacterized protein n=1 Tax=Microvirga lotononidis TaxID=864069 RepID=I4Z077_9HYPH|nr:hypothetical protein MicloDRAFT_00021000 [Microvirga lotononidis]
MKSCRPAHARGGRDRTESAADAPAKNAGRVVRTREPPAPRRNAASDRLAAQARADRAQAKNRAPSAPVASPARRPSGRLRLRKQLRPARLRLPPRGPSPRPKGLKPR